ncbi:hypothetical protein DSO57_1036461 [Entomophthora muscae]|uniref:Uncharacterized protein n=1 Tax=Entomophthora muscae TaxID=34485 RepID=A0ACC2TL01_9FUNG|nr:hypothetical protein DSO57_1036461 [Entomophthora muscae]
MALLIILLEKRVSRQEEDPGSNPVDIITGSGGNSEPTSTGDPIEPKRGNISSPLPRNKLLSGKALLTVKPASQDAAVPAKVWCWLADSERESIHNCLNGGMTVWDIVS